MADGDALDVTEFVTLANLNLAEVLSESEARVYLSNWSLAYDRGRPAYERQQAKEMLNEMARYILRRLVRQLAVARLQEGDQDDGEDSADQKH